MSIVRKILAKEFGVSESDIKNINPDPLPEVETKTHVDVECEINGVKNRAKITVTPPIIHKR